MKQRHETDLMRQRDHSLPLDLTSQPHLSADPHTRPFFLLQLPAFMFQKLGTADKNGSAESFAL